MLSGGSHGESGAELTPKRLHPFFHMPSLGIHCHRTSGSVRLGPNMAPTPKVSNHRTWEGTTGSLGLENKKLLEGVTLLYTSWILLGICV